MIQESRVLTAFPENPGLTPSMHMADYNRLPLQLIERPLLDSMGPEMYLSGRCLLNMCMALGLIPRTGKQQQQQ